MANDVKVLKLITGEEVIARVSEEHRFTYFRETDDIANDTPQYLNRTNGVCIGALDKGSKK